MVFYAKCQENMEIDDLTRCSEVVLQANQLKRFVDMQIM